MPQPFLRPVALVLAVLLATGPVRASTDGQPSDWGISELGGSATDRQRLYAGTPGILMASAPAAFLLIGWRRLHGQTVSTEAGEALATPCCGGLSYGPTDVVKAWLDARKTVPGAPPLDTLETERAGPDYTSRPNCLDDSFRTAVRTLGERAGTHPGDPALGAWLAAQDAVFRACATPGVTLPAVPAGSPDWLQADRRYQEAALAFYDARYPDAAAAFAAIGGDAGSPWQPIAPYLRMRALLRQALASGTAADFAAAQAAAAAVPGALHDSAAKLGGMAQLRADPAAAAARLLAALGADTLGADAAADFKDLQTLSVPAEPTDWIATFKTGAALPPPGAPGTDDTAPPPERARGAEKRRVAALDHARERYAASHDVAWLLASLVLMQPGDADAAATAAEAAALDPAAPAFLTALYHRVRLTIGTADPATLRASLDAVLARTDLTATTRNLFTAERMLVAADLHGMAQLAMRARVCVPDSENCRNNDWGVFGFGDGLFDAEGDAARRGLGDDARYLVDRMALAPRMAFGADAALPAPVRLDLALTNFVRAVLLRDDAAADALCPVLQGLLPAMAADFAAIPKARRGADKLFAEYFVFAKIPGLRADLLDYTRPVGQVADFGGHWPNWVVLAAPDPDSIPPAPVLYGNAPGQAIDVPAGFDLGEGHVRLPDAVCKGLCGAGGFVPRPPPFLAATAARATAERRFLPPPAKYGDPASTSYERAAAFPDPSATPPKPLPAPAGATYVWEFVLDYAAKHPQDPRAPEALHWLVHVGHYGQSHDHSGKRAFLLLKSRYPASPWAKQNQFYFD